ncbi:hypothetical protein B0H63DRAFT_529819 [Podospora didyma]|uniref:Uncharacterized protein n=1 Tax=Podospora didyma TaxID=330526 RepID=A0AAE0JZA9_9PEZI|nr:hypothetical protein B0H63DRAFT_529819 [Podospora didyma]
MLDSGAIVECISPDFCRRLGLTIRRLDVPSTINLASDEHNSIDSYWIVNILVAGAMTVAMAFVYGTGEAYHMMLSLNCMGTKALYVTSAQRSGIVDIRVGEEEDEATFSGYEEDSDQEYGTSFRALATATEFVDLLEASGMAPPSEQSTSSDCWYDTDDTEPTEPRVLAGNGDAW